MIRNKNDENSDSATSGLSKHLLSRYSTHSLSNIELLLTYSIVRAFVLLISLVKATFENHESS